LRFTHTDGDHENVPRDPLELGAIDLARFAGRESHEDPVVVGGETRQSDNYQTQ
jgi:hypothetical protein